MKTTNLILAILCLSLYLSCENDTTTLNSNSNETTLNNSSALESNRNSERRRGKYKGTLPKSDFDFEANTITMNVNGDQFPVVDTGEGPVVLLLHGWPDSKEMWRYQIPFLVNAGYRVIAPDLRGFGDAPKTENIAAYGLASLMGDVITILDNLEIDKVNLIAHDWGAALGWTMARFAQDRVNSFISIAIGAPGNPGYDTLEQRRHAWYFYLFAQPQEGLAEYELSNNDWALFRDLVFHPDEDNVINSLSEPDALSSSMRIYKANLQHLLAGCSSEPFEDPFEVEFPLVKAPTLGLLGEFDFAALEPMMSYSIDHVVAGNFEYKYLNDLGHWMMLENPKKINKLIKNFLDCNVLSNCD